MPKGIEHLAVADEMAHVLLLEPADLLDTGNAPASALTAESVEKI